MPEKASNELRIVEVMRAFRIGGPASYEVKAGSRVWARRSPSGWRVMFNGAEIVVSDGTVGDLDSVEVKQAAEERRSAREEEYQLAPSSKAKA